MIKQFVEDIKNKKPGAVQSAIVVVVGVVLIIVVLCLP